MSLKSALPKISNVDSSAVSGLCDEARLVLRNAISCSKNSSAVNEDDFHNAQNMSKCDNDQDHGDCDYEDDDGLFEALKHIPVKVELEEGDVRDETRCHEGNSEAEGTSASGAPQSQDGVASTSGNEANGNHTRLNEEPKNLPKKKRKRRRLRRSYFSEEEKLARRKIYARERAKKYRDSLTEEQLETLKQKVRERARQRRLQMSEEECVLTRVRNREQAQIRRFYNEQVKPREVKTIIRNANDEEKAMLIREKNRERMRMKRSNMTEEQKIIERQKNRERVRKKREMQKAENLLRRLMNVHGDNPNNDHFLQTMIKKEGEEDGQKLDAMMYDNELVESADDAGYEHSAQKQL